MSERPLLFLDVDGPLNPWDAPPHRRPAGYLTHRYPQYGLDEYDRPKKPLRVWLNPAHGERLRALPFELVWATYWLGEANAWVSPKIGLPDDLPTVPLVESLRPGQGWAEGWGAQHVSLKIPQLVKYAAGRPFAWVDDEIALLDDDYVRRHHGKHALLRWVSPRLGLLENDFEALREWAAAALPVLRKEPA